MRAATMNKPINARCQRTILSIYQWRAKRVAALAILLAMGLLSGCQSTQMAKEADHAMACDCDRCMKMASMKEGGGMKMGLSSTVGSEAWNSRDLKSRPH